MNRMVCRRMCVAVALAAVAAAVCADDAAPAAVPPVSDARVQEIKNLRWGMFICWSFSTFSGREWTGGVEDVGFFRATEVDTDQWARTAKEAEMGYILFLAKHHDGFCLWDTQTTDRKVTKAPLGRDVLAELRKSCDQHGIKLALYFSEGDWTWPGSRDGQLYGSGPNPEAKKAQLKELLTQYGPIEYIWFDHAAGTGGLSHAETIAWVKSFQPDCLVGFNHGDQTGSDIRLGERGRPGPLDDHGAAGPHMGDAPSGSYRVAEFTYPILPGKPPRQGGADWFYSLPEYDHLVHPPEKLYADYLGAVKHENLFSINVGPDYRGRLREVDVKTLRAVGEMIRNPPPPPLSQGAAVRASSEWGPGYEAARAVDGDAGSRWGAAADARAGWLEVDLGREEAIGRVEIIEVAHPRTREFSVEVQTDGAWKEVLRGTTIGGRRSHEIPATRARVVRLNILQADEVPTIEEFQLFPPAPAAE